MRRIALAWLAGLPLGLAGAAYAWLALAHGTAALLPVVVHEDGRRTLAATVWYPRHIVRELPVSALFALGAVGAWAAYGPRRRLRGGGRRRAACAAGALILATAAVSGAADELGWRGVAGELGQRWTRDDEPPRPGAHWAYHLLSTLTVAGAAIALAGVVQRALDGGFREPDGRARAVWLGSAGLAGAVATGVWGGLAKALTDPRTLGHQAREAATHVAVTLPLTLAVLLALQRAGADPEARRPRPAPDLLVALGVAGAAAIWLAAGTLLTGSLAEARAAAGASALVAAHLFEHAVDGLIVLLLAGALAPGGDPCPSP